MDYLKLLEQGIDQWNQWRLSHPDAACRLEGHDLSHGYFFEGNFQGADLRGVNLQRACLVGANFQNADLTGANLSGAYLGDANFYGANLAHANFTKAALERADMRRANLLGTQFVEVDLRTVKLPDPTLAPYGVEMGHLLTSQPTTQQQPVPTRQETVAKAKALQGRRATDKPSIAVRFIAPLKPRSRENPKELADRQQNIRLSAIPARRSTDVKHTSPFTSRQATPKQPAPRQAPNKPKPLAQNLSRPIQTGEKAKQTKGEKKWGRRQSDQRMAALLGHSVRQKQPWGVVLAAAGLAMAVSLPFAIPTLVSSQQETAAQSVTTLALTKSLTGTGQIWAIATHTPSNGNPQIIAGESNGNIEIWDGQTGETLQTFTGQSEGIQSIAMSAAGQWLISSSSKGLNVWNPETGELVHTLSTENKTIRTVAITPDERTFLSSDEDGVITAWDIASGQPRYQVNSQVNSGDAVWDVAIAPNGESFVSSSGSLIRQWDIATGKVLKEFTGHTDTVRTVAISPDGTTLASGSWDQTIKLWNLATGDLQTTLSGHTDQIASLAISADSTTLASNSSDRTLKLWDIPSRRLTKTLDHNTDTAIAIAFAQNGALSDSANGQTLISGGTGQTINVWQ